MCRSSTKQRSRTTADGRAEVLELPRDDGACVVGTRVGWIAGWDGARGPLVDYPGNQSGPIPARSTVPLSKAAAIGAIESRQGVVLLFERERPDLPLVVGLLQPPVDRRFVEISGDEKIVLRCGKASLTLTRAGKLILRGTHVVSRSTGANRIRGGSIELN